MKKSFLILSFIFYFFSGANAQVKPDDFTFSGKDRNVSYKTEREIGLASYTLQNNSKKEVKLKLVGAFLVRGKYADPLPGGKIRVFYKGKYRKQKFIVLKPGQKVEFEVAFKPFQIYTGSNYAVRTILQLPSGKRIKADAHFDLFKQNRVDKNRIKEK